MPAGKEELQIQTLNEFAEDKEEIPTPIEVEVKVIEATEINSNIHSTSDEKCKADEQTQLEHFQPDQNRLTRQSVYKLDNNNKAQQQVHFKHFSLFKAIEIGSIILTMNGKKIKDILTSTTMDSCIF